MTSRIKEKKANKHKVKLNRFQVGLIKRKAGERAREKRQTTNDNIAGNGRIKVKQCI